MNRLYLVLIAMGIVEFAVLFLSKPAPIPNRSKEIAELFAIRAKYCPGAPPLEQLGPNEFEARCCPWASTSAISMDAFLERCANKPKDWK